MSISSSNRYRITECAFLLFPLNDPTDDGELYSTKDVWGTGDPTGNVVVQSYSIMMSWQLGLWADNAIPLQAHATTQSFVSVVD